MTVGLQPSWGLVRFWRIGLFSGPFRVEYYGPFPIQMQIKMRVRFGPVWNQNWAGTKTALAFPSLNGPVRIGPDLLTSGSIPAHMSTRWLELSSRGDGDPSRSNDEAARGDHGVARGDHGAAWGNCRATPFSFLVLLAGDSLALYFVLVLSPSSRVLRSWTAALDGRAGDGGAAVATMPSRAGEGRAAAGVVRPSHGRHRIWSLGRTGVRWLRVAVDPGWDGKHDTIYLTFFAKRTKNCFCIQMWSDQRLVVLWIMVPCSTVPSGPRGSRSRHSNILGI